VQSSKKQKVASGDQGEQERADASEKLAGFELKAHTEELLRKQDNNLGTVVEQLRAADLQTKKFL
jgi:hypothetical protein